MDKKNIDGLLFLKSALTIENPFIDIVGIKQWLARRNAEVGVNIRKIKFSHMDQWSFDPADGNLRHNSGKFFSIDGLKIKTNWGQVEEWSQPIINQPEIGFLGIIAREIDGILYFLMQAKIEPGNVNHVQLSPTLQATKSNYTQVHKGRKPLYLEYFMEKKKHKVLVDQLQSEQGARFYKKRNRNMIIQVNQEIPIYDDFAWLTLGQIKQLMKEDNLVNMDSRTVIAGIPFGEFRPDVIDFFNIMKDFHTGVDPYKQGMLRSTLLSSLISGAGPGISLYDFDEILSWLAQVKTDYELTVEKIPLREVHDWVRTDESIHHKSNKYFSVLPVSVEIDNREVRTWSQPLMQPAQEGLCAFVVKIIHGVYHFLVQAKVECGNLDVLELAPTVQCLTGNYRDTKKGALPFLDYVLNAKEDRIRFDTLQSEEGGRFFREQNRNLIIEAESDFDENLPPHYTWMTLSQLKLFLKFNNYLNIQARSLISAIDFI
ncbi:MAG: NDP-hexose 2,3-dehydratase [bacterium]|nr:NDP-hexose 2,3-dehydratase [bacterium]